MKKLQKHYRLESGKELDLVFEMSDTVYAAIADAMVVNSLGIKAGVLVRAYAEVPSTATFTVCQDKNGNTVLVDSGAMKARKEREVVEQLTAVKAACAAAGIQWNSKVEQAAREKLLAE